jgi:hypothetical protein
MIAAFVAMGFFAAPFYVFFAAMLGFNIMLFLARRSTPHRMDYNLALRAWANELGDPGDVAMGSIEATPDNLRSFAQFMGELYLIRDYRMQGERIIMRMMPVKNNAATMFLPFFQRIMPASEIMLNVNGDCVTNIISSDFNSLIKLGKGESNSLMAIKQEVEDVVSASFKSFVSGDTQTAHSLLEAKSEKEIFQKPPHTLKSQKTMYIIAIVAPIVSFLLFFLAFALSRM